MRVYKEKIGLRIASQNHCMRNNIVDNNEVAGQRPDENENDKNNIVDIDGPEDVDPSGK